MKRRYLLLVGLACALPLAAQAPKKLSLDDCLRLAESHQPDLAAAQALVDEAQAGVKAAQSRRRPQVDLGTSYTRQTYNFAASPGTAPRQVNLFSNGESLSNAPYYYAGTNLSQLIYDGGGTRDVINRSEAQYEAATRNAQRVHDLVYLNVRRAYYSVLAAQEILQAREDAVANQRRHLQQVEAFHNVGSRPKIDVTKQEVALAGAEVDLRQAQENLQVARAALATAMGIPIEQAPELEPTLETVREPDPLDALMAEAEKQRPDLQAQRAEVSASDADIAVARSAYRPSVYLGSFFNYRNLQFPLIYNLSLGGLLGQTLFDGGARRAQLATAEAGERAARANLESLRQKVRQEVYKDYSDVQVARDKITLTEKALAEAKENLELAEGRYQAGYGNIIELTDAQSLLTDSQVAAIVARYDYQTAAANLDVAVDRAPKP